MTKLKLSMPPTDLWIIPRSFDPLETRPDLAHNLEAYRSKQAALNACKHNWKYPAWRDGIAAPVHFSIYRGIKPIDMNAPADSWFLVDLDNGNPETLDGRIWVFPFSSRAKAREYSQRLSKQRARIGSSIIDVSPPFQLFQ